MKYYFDTEWDTKFWSFLPQINYNGHAKEMEFQWLCASLIIGSKKNHYKYQEPEMIDDMGKRKWHRIFGWVTVTHPYGGSGVTLVDSDHKHVQHFIPGKGWIDYVGTGKDGNIVSICMNKNELYDQEQKDEIQEEVNLIRKVLA